MSLIFLHIKHEQHDRIISRGYAAQTERCAPLSRDLGFPPGQSLLPKIRSTVHSHYAHHDSPVRVRSYCSLLPKTFLFSPFSSFMRARAFAFIFSRHHVCSKNWKLTTSFAAVFFSNIFSTTSRPYLTQAYYIQFRFLTTSPPALYLTRIYAYKQ